MSNGPHIGNPAISAYLKRLVGDEGYRVIQRLPPDWITDERIAEMTNTKLNTVRRTLNILYENRLAEYRRERNEENGWLTYIWRLNSDNIGQVIQAESDKLSQILRHRLDFERDNIFYVCRNGYRRFHFDTATELAFRCPECDSELEYEDNDEIVDAIKRRIDELKDE